MGCVVPEMPSNMVEIFLTKYHACRQAKAKSFGRRRTFIDSQFLMPGSFGLFFTFVMTANGIAGTGQSGSSYGKPGDSPEPNRNCYSTT